MKGSTTPAPPPHGFELATVRLRDEKDVVHLCRHTRTFGEQVGLDRHAVRRLSTAAHEVAQRLFESQSPCPTAVLTVAEGPSLQVDFRAVIAPAQREQVTGWVGQLHTMVHRLSLLEEDDEVRVRMVMLCPTGAGVDKPAVPEQDRPGREARASELAGLKRAHRELQAELQETNRGVVALYAELDDRAARLLAAETDLRRRAEELAAANRTKEEFLATLSHELRTPLNAMLGWTRLLRSGRLDAPMVERALETIERNARVQEQLIADILDVSRIVTGKLRLQLRPVELAPILEAAIDGVRPAADARSLSLRTAIANEGRLVLGDPDRLQQVFWNLLANAIKFTPVGGTVTISLSAAGDYMVVVVRDTGEGILPDLLPYIFDRFWQGDTSVTRSHGGLGLGLSIVRHIVELHGGRVAVESEGPGRGSTFTLMLPVQ